MRVNLLPPEVRRARRDAAVARRIRFVGLVALLLLGGLYGIRTYEVITLRGELDRLATERTAAEAERASLGAVAEARDAAVAGQSLAEQVLRGEISWSAQLLALSAAVPPGFTLTSMSGQASPEAVGGIVGSVAFSASSRDFAPTQTWLIRIASEERWTNGWVSSITSGEGGFSLSGSYDLTPLAISPRGGGPA